MDDPTDRKRGLPITRALMESLIQEITWRVKGTEKLLLRATCGHTVWNAPVRPRRCPSILALKTAAHYDDNRLEHRLDDRT